jgi:hypothetical protein
MGTIPTTGQWIRDNEESLSTEYWNEDTKLMWIEWCIEKFIERVLDPEEPIK